MRRRSRKRGPSSPAEALRISLTIAGEKASNSRVAVYHRPSREEKLLSDHVLSFFGRTITITSHEELLAIIVMVVVATAWAVQQFRRRRSIVLQRSVVSASRGIYWRSDSALHVRAVVPKNQGERQLLPNSVRGEQQGHGCARREELRQRVRFGACDRIPSL